MAIIISLLIGLVMGYAIGWFVSINKNAKPMIDISNENDTARNKANKRWRM